VLTAVTFAAGAEYASLQAAARLASAELQVKEELGVAERAERAEQELLLVERENVVKVGKEEGQRAKLDTEFMKEEIKKLDKIETVELPNTDEMKVTVFENEVAKDEEESPFSFERNSDELMKISVREDDDDINIKITIKEADDEDLKLEDKEEVINLNPYSQYKMPTF
jgi:multidrug efflux pump subunit AcrA (membrane-fusion protein)